MQLVTGSKEEAGSGGGRQNRRMAKGWGIWGSLPQELCIISSTTASLAAPGRCDFLSFTSTYYWSEPLSHEVASSIFASRVSFLGLEPERRTWRTWKL